MTDTLCNYPDRDERLVSYLYDDIDSAERTAFGAHLSTCGACQEDLSALRGVRSALSAWAPPEPAFAKREPRAPSLESRLPSPEPRAANPEPRAPRWWHEVPVWAQVAAALFVAGLSATIANLDVRYDGSGLTVRTGWSKPQAAPENAAWRAELAALETQLRAKIDARQASALAVQAAAEQTPKVDEQELRRRVQVLLDEREKRIQNEIALAVGSVIKDYQGQRQADLARIDRSIVYLQDNTLREQLKQREAVNYLLKVSQTR